MNREKTLRLIIEALESEGISAVAFDRQGKEVVSVSGRGLKPLFNVIKEGLKKPYRYLNLYWGDKVLGKAAVMLLLFLKPAFVYGKTLSEAGEEVLKDEKIPYSYGKLVAFIQNRDATGMCPFEDAVKEAGTKEEALTKIEELIRKFSEGKS